MARYTCNKKAYPSFRDDCKKCPEYDPCLKGGKWCFVGAMENDRVSCSATQDVSMSAAAPIMRDMSTVTINLGDGMKVDVLREDMKKQLENELYKGMNLPWIMNGA